MDKNDKMSVSEILESCRAYQRHGTPLLLLWLLQSSALCVIYWWTITRNGVRAKYWPRCIILAQCLTLLTSVIV